MNERVRVFLDEKRPKGPCLLIDLEVVRANYQAFEDVLPGTRVFYAVKANPAPEILRVLAGLGSSFDCASVGELELVLGMGISPDRVSFGNTIKKRCDIERAFSMGIRLFVADCHAEVDKLACAAPGSDVFCRILCDGSGADWPLSRKFGCEPEMAVDLLSYVRERGLKPRGISFHVGSQQGNPSAWDRALAVTASIFKDSAERGMPLETVNLGGGFPACGLGGVPNKRAYGGAISRALKGYFGHNVPETFIEPGRGMVADAGVIKAEVVLISRKRSRDEKRWVYLDIGKFGGLAETMGEAIRYPIRTSRDSGEKGPVVLAGPTCDSVDVLYEKTPCFLPVSLQIGDEVLIEATGAYTMTYAANYFNGIPPLAYFVV